MKEDRFYVLEKLIKGDSLNGKNFEFLGDYYLEQNKEKAYLCYENAMFLGNIDEEEIKGKMWKLEQEGVNRHKVSIVILSYNAKEMMIECVESIRRNNPEQSYQLVVVDNASQDGITDWLKEQRDIVLRCNEENAGFPKGCNQGIQLSEKQNDIMLLNNDTIVTENALFWLRMALCEEKMGAVGSISNMTEKISSTGKGRETRSIPEQLKQAVYNNVLMEYPYENAIFLLGYALLVSREALEKTGYLDEVFSPGNFEDSDFCLRLIYEGYRLALCYNSFIFHYGSLSFKQDKEWYENLITKNYYLYNAKHGFDVDYYTRQRLDLIEHLPQDTGKAFRILDIGCGCGNTLLRIKGLYPKAEIMGVEKFPKAAEIGNRVAEIYCMDIEKEELPFEKESFDFIIMGNILEQLQEPEKILCNVRKYLKDNGKVIASVYNSGNIKNIYAILRGSYLDTERYGLWDKKNINGFTGENLVLLFQKCGFKIQDVTYVANELTPEEEQFLNLVETTNIDTSRELLEAYNYILIAENHS